jgi:iron complex outermembrane receptor protein
LRRTAGGTLTTLRDLGLLALVGVLLPLAARAQASGDAAAPVTTLPTTEVVGTSPLLGSGIDRDKVPSNVRSLTDRDLLRPPDLGAALDQRNASVNINGVQDSPYQPDIQFRGFDASPLIGTPQGLAVYQNGVRINEAFGDTVNWDLVPEFAINRLNLITGNPVFGLNALGGALAIEMKNGFNFQGGQAALSGGSFGRREGVLEYGVEAGNFASYIGGRALFEDGWRDHSPSSIHQLYTDIGARNDSSSLHLSFAGASNLINAIGPTPVDLLAQSRAAVFTTPQSTRNDLAFVTLTGSHKVDDTTALDANVYYRHFRQRTANGNTSNAQVCADPTLLCFGDATTPLIGQGGTQVTNFLNGLDPGEIDRTSTTANGLGGSLQVTNTTPIFDHGNHFVAGASIDHGSVDFRARSEIGAIELNSALLVSGNGITIVQPDGTVAPVHLNTTNSYYGLYVTDTFDVTDRLALTASGRFNLALVRLTDLNGTALDGDHRFSRFNPGAGATYKLMPNLTAYAGYSEANRAPTPAELGCADPSRPCVLDIFVVSDPNLKQVVARTWETGLRGSFPGLEESGRFSWNLGLFRTDSQDDILNVPSDVTGFGFFRNVGGTRRQGLEAGAAYRSDKWFAYIDYSLVDATFRSNFTLRSPGNPFGDANGDITVHSGDHLPSTPQHRLKFGTQYAITTQWKLGSDVIVASDQYLRGDESNQNPKIPGYVVVNLNSSYEINDHVELFGRVTNLFGAQYETFGAVFDPATIPSLNLSTPRSLSPAPPRAAWIGVRASF